MIKDFIVKSNILSIIVYRCLFVNTEGVTNYENKYKNERGI